MKKIISILLSVILIALIAISIYVSREKSSEAIWEKQFDFKVYSDPICAEGKIYFIGGDKGRNKLFIYELDEQGNITAQSPQLPSSPYEPIYVDCRLIIADMSGVVRAFSVPKLNVVWEKSTEKQMRTINPCKLDDKRVLVVYNDNLSRNTAGGENAIYCLNASDGSEVWSSRIETPISKLAYDDIIICVHKNPDVFSKYNSYSGTALNKETGETEWQIGDIDNVTPLVIEKICIFSTINRQTIIVDGDSGDIRFTNPEIGYKPVSVLGTSFVSIKEILKKSLKESERKLTVTSLETGNEWSVNLTKQYINCVLQGTEVIIADKSNIQSRNLSDGTLNWNIELKDIYNLYEYRGGIFTTHKESFTSRKTYGRFINIQNRKDFWTAIDSNVFMKPVQLKDNDFIITSNGYARLMPKAQSADSMQIDPFAFKRPNKNKQQQTKEPVKTQEQQSKPQEAIKVDFPDINFNKDNQKQNNPNMNSDLERKAEW